MRGGISWHVRSSERRPLASSIAFVRSRAKFRARRAWRLSNGGREELRARNQVPSTGLSWSWPGTVTLRRSTSCLIDSGLRPRPGAVTSTRSARPCSTASTASSALDTVRQVIVSGKPAGCAGSDHWRNHGLRASVNTVPSSLGATWYGPVPGSGESSSPTGVPGGAGDQQRQLVEELRVRGLEVEGHPARGVVRHHARARRSQVVRSSMHACAPDDARRRSPVALLVRRYAVQRAAHTELEVGGPDLGAGGVPDPGPEVEDVGPAPVGRGRDRVGEVRDQRPGGRRPSTAGRPARRRRCGSAGCSRCRRRGPGRTPPRAPGR